MPHSELGPSLLTGTGGAPDEEVETASSSPPDDALALAEAEAAEADALAAAASARVRLIRERRMAQSTAVAGSVGVEHKGKMARVDQATDADVPGVELEQDLATATDRSEAHPVRRRHFRLPPIRIKLVTGVLMIILALGFLGAAEWMILRHHRVVETQHRSAEYAAAARQGVVTLMSLDFKHAQKDIQRVLDNTTGDFKKDFERQADDFTKAAQESRVVIEATVNVVAVQSMTPDSATVLVVATTRGSNIEAKDQQSRSWRVSVGLRRDGGQIKMAKVEFIP
jgi:Mce-associated membrane protein